MSSYAGPQEGPCTAWIDGADVAVCHPIAESSDGPAFYDAYALEASALLFELSGRKYGNGCVQTVRPCRAGCGCWGAQYASGVNPVWWWGAYPAGGNVWAWHPGAGCGEGVGACGCGTLSRAKLSGYPVTGIVEVKINGEVLPEVDEHGNPNWRLDGWRWLTRMADPNVDNPDQGPIARWWPGCQNLALADDQPGTWSITYEYGPPPPQAGFDAAIQLAYELSQFCAGAECKLPAGATRVVRQGVTIERGLFSAWARNGKTGAWFTGMAQVDSFLNAYNPSGQNRRTAVWGPGGQRFAQKLGQ